MRIVGILLRPSATWEELRAANPAWTDILLRHAVPLALVLAVAWPMARHASGDTPRNAAALVAATFSMALAATLSLALGFYVLAPWYSVARRWSASLAVAAYANTPVLLAAALLASPLLALFAIVAFLHGFALSSMGAQQLLGCRASEAMEYAVAAWIFATLAAMLLAGLCSAAGLI